MEPKMTIYARTGVEINTEISTNDKLDTKDTNDKLDTKDTKDKLDNKDTKDSFMIIDGDKFWHKNGVLHRENGPAIEFADGSFNWFRDGKLHRDDGPAVKSRKYLAWYQFGEFHREDGPAVINGSCLSWYINGKRHREDGPAVERKTEHNSWWLYGELHCEIDIENIRALENNGKGKSIYCHGYCINDACFPYKGLCL